MIIFRPCLHNSIVVIDASTYVLRFVWKHKVKLVASQVIFLLNWRLLSF